MTWVGKRLPQREDQRLVRGAGTYVDDLHLPGMVHVAIVRSPHAHARIRAIHGDCVTAADLMPQIEPFRLNHIGSEKRPLSYHALVIARVRYVGEAVAAGVAESRYAAETKADGITVEYEPLPTVVNCAQAAAPGAPRLYDHWPDNELIHHVVQHGDVDAALAQADLVVTERFRSHRHTAHPMETRGLVAQYDGEVLTVWASHQMPHMLRTFMAQCLRLPEHRVRVITPNVGGGFGVKYNFYPEDVLIPWLAVRLRKPVKWIEDRREHFLSTAHAREQEHTVTLGLSKEGRLLAVRTEAEVDLGSGAIILPGVGPMFGGAASMPMGYKFEHYHYSGRGYVTNKTPYGAYRAFGVSVVAFVLERAMDIVADKLGLDPAELRRRNLLTPADLPYRNPTGSYFLSGSFRRSFDAALEAAGYEALRAKQAEARQQGKLFGIGVASFVEGTGASQFALSQLWGGWEYCRIAAAADGSLTVYSGNTNQGQSTETTLAQLVADEMGVHPEQVRVIMGDTDRVPYGMGAFASRGAMLGGAATLRAAADLKARFCRLAAELAECDPADLEYVDGAVQMKGAPAKRWTLAELCRPSYGQARTRSGTGLPTLEGEGRFDMTAIPRPPDPFGRVPRYAAWSDGACVVTCEVDRETGAVKLGQVVIAHDCGRVINPVAVDGQMVGGFAQALGGTFLEDLVYDDQGQLLTASFMDYLLPTAADMPPVQLVHLETPAPEIPGGAKGTGESATIVGPAALANAVADALRPLGVTVRETPLSPSRIWHLIQSAPKGGDGP